VDIAQSYNVHKVYATFSIAARNVVFFWEDFKLRARKSCCISSMPRSEYSSATLAAVLIDIQNGSCSHSKCLDRLIYLHFKDSERFKRDFAGHLNRILVAAGDKRDINIEKLVNLVIDFAAGKEGTEEDNHYKRQQFALFTIQHLLARTSVKDKSIRYKLRIIEHLSGINSWWIPHTALGLGELKF
jgi:hypothetical protein